MVVSIGEESAGFGKGIPETESQQVLSHLQIFELYAINRRGYEVVKYIQEGTQGRIFLGEQKYGKRLKVAIKIVSAQKESSQNELDTLMELKGVKNMLQLIDFFQVSDSLFLITEYIAGGDLLDALGRFKYEIQDVIKMMENVLQAVVNLHAKHIVHRDLKLENVMLYEQNSKLSEIALIDFGLARHLTARNSIITRDFAGTLCYCPPEVVQYLPYSPYKADMWSFGVVFHAMLTNKFPFGNQDSFSHSGVTSSRFRIVNEQLDLTIPELSNAPAALKGLLLMLLDKDPDGRPTASETLTYLKVIEESTFGNDSEKNFVQKSERHQLLISKMIQKSESQMSLCSNASSTQEDTQVWTRNKIPIESSSAKESIIESMALGMHQRHS